MTRIFRPILAIAAMAFILAPPHSYALEEFVKVDPRGTYLATDPNPFGDGDPDGALPATTLTLNPLGIEAGDVLELTLLGAYSPGPDLNDDIEALMAVFGSGEGFLAPGPQSNAPSVTTQPSCPRELETDIDEDFAVLTSGVGVQVPTGASALLFSPNDCFFEDNSDPNQDYGALITGVILISPTDDPQGDELNLTGFPNTEAEASFSVSGGTPPYAIDARLGAVEPATIQSEGGSGSFRFTPPAHAALGEVFEDTIVVTDATGQTASLPVTITTEDRPLSETGMLSPAQRSAAEAIEELCPQATGAFKQQCDALIEEASDAELRRALSQIAHDDLAAQGTQAVELPATQVSNITERIRALRAGNTGAVALDGLSFDIGGRNLPAGALMTAALGTVLAGDVNRSRSEFAERWGVFLNGSVNVGDKDATAREPGFDFQSKGVTLGTDYRLTERFFVGGSIGYGSTDTDFDADGGGIDTDAVTASLFGSYYSTQSFYIDWIATYGSNDYDSRRTIDPIPGTGFTGGDAEGDTNGDQLTLSLNAGGEISRGAWLFNPSIRFKYVETNIDELRETQRSGLALAVDEQTVRSLTTAAGGQITRVVRTNWGVLNPSAHAEWIHEFKDDEREITARFIDEPKRPFSVETDGPDRNYFLVGASVTAVLPNARSAFLRYETQLGLDDLQTHSIRAGVRIAF